MFVASVDMESSFRTKSVSTNPHLHRTCVCEPLSSNGLFYVDSLQREYVFGEPLASNKLPLWLHYSSFQTSCHNNGFLDLHSGLILNCMDYIMSNGW
jgi:hypothetical protein